MKASGRSVVVSMLVLLLVALPLPYLLRFDHSHIVTAAVLAATLCALSLRSHEAGVAGTLGLLIMLGDYRRYVGYFEGYPASDALLLVAPASAFFLCCLSAVSRSRVSGSGSLQLTILLLAVLMMAQMFNPAQGDLTVGLGGALFYLVPLLWFWIGWVFGDRTAVDLVLRKLIVDRKSTRLNSSHRL